VDTLVVEACVDPATREDRVVRFWQRAGLERCSHEYFDNHERQTNKQRSQRVSGRAVRTMSGVFAFPDSCMMFRGTAAGWRLGDARVVLPAGLEQCCGLGQEQLVPDPECRPDSSPAFDGSVCGTEDVLVGDDASAAAVLEEGQKPGVLTVSISAITSPLKAQHSDPGVPLTALSGCRAPELVSSFVVPLASTPLHEDAGQPTFTDHVRFLTGCMCFSCHAGTLLWSARQPAHSDVLQTPPSESTKERGPTHDLIAAGTDGAAAQDSQRCPSPAPLTEEDMKAESKDAEASPRCKASFMSRAGTMLLRVLVWGCVGRTGVVE
jgi:hypothetical protein